MSWENRDMLVGRDRERRELESALECARAGESATLALVGEPGIGKTALLDFAAGRATAMRVLRARGIESEAEIPFASLLELVRPALGLLERIPPPQAIALEGALALRPSQARERFAVGAATLSLLAAYAEDGPVAVLIDDAQWLDQVSAEALLFAVRRLVADPIAVLIAVREGEPSLIDGAGLRTVRVVGLSAGETAALLPGIGPDSVRRLHEATAGNPLALLESGRDPGEFALAPDGAPLLVSARIARAFLRRTGGFSERERRALLLAATSESGDLVLLERAAAASESSSTSCGRRSVRDSSRWEPGRSNSVIHSRARRSTPTRRPRTDAPRTGRLRRRCLTATSTGAHGTWRRQPRGPILWLPPRSSRLAFARVSAARTRVPPPRSSAPHA